MKNIYIIMILLSFYFSVNRVSAQINYWTPTIIPQNLFYSFIDLSPSLNWLSRSLNYVIYGWPNTYGIFNGNPLPYNAITVYDYYHERNAQEYPLGYYFNFNAPYELVSYEAMFDLSSGVTSFSNVGFNPERTLIMLKFLFTFKFSIKS